MRELIDVIKSNPRSVTAKFNISAAINQIHYKFGGILRPHPNIPLFVTRNTPQEEFIPAAGLCYEYFGNQVPLTPGNRKHSNDAYGMIEQYLDPTLIYANIDNRDVRLTYLDEDTLRSIGYDHPPCVTIENELIHALDLTLAALSHWMSRHCTFHHRILYNYPLVYVVRLDDYRVYEYERMIKERKEYDANDT